jgi:hypothetical protein
MPTLSTPFPLFYIIHILVWLTIKSVAYFALGAAFEVQTELVETLDEFSVGGVGPREY